MQLQDLHWHLTENIFSVQQQGKIQFLLYEIDPETGLLEKKFTLPISGDYPKDLVIFPDNRHIAIANHASNTITVFAVDYEKNIIVMNDRLIKSKPLTTFISGLSRTNSKT